MWVRITECARADWAWRKHTGSADGRWTRPCTTHGENNKRLTSRSLPNKNLSTWCPNCASWLPCCLLHLTPTCHGPKCVSCIVFSLRLQNFVIRADLGWLVFFGIYVLPEYTLVSWYVWLLGSTNGWRKHVFFVDLSVGWNYYCEYFHDVSSFGSNKSWIWFSLSCSWIHGLSYNYHHHLLSHTGLSTASPLFSSRLSVPSSSRWSSAVSVWSADLPNKCWHANAFIRIRCVNRTLFKEKQQTKTTSEKISVRSSKEHHWEQCTEGDYTSVKLTPNQFVFMIPATSLTILSSRLQ